MPFFEDTRGVVVVEDVQDTPSVLVVRHSPPVITLPYEVRERRVGYRVSGPQIVQKDA